jgi:hypothetical protein
MLFRARDARSVGLSAGGAGSVCCCCGWGCAMEPCRAKPGRFGAGVLTNAPGVGRCGVAGAIWKAIVGMCGGGDGGGSVCAGWRPVRARASGGAWGDAPTIWRQHQLRTNVPKEDGEEGRAGNEIKKVPWRNCDARWGGSSGTGCKSDGRQQKSWLGEQGCSCSRRVRRPNFLISGTQ